MIEFTSDIFFYQVTARSIGQYLESNSKDTQIIPWSMVSLVLFMRIEEVLLCHRFQTSLDGAGITAFNLISLHCFHNCNSLLEC